MLRTIKLGETDRIVTILTQGHGKVRAVAKGVRKPGSRFGARLEPTSHVALQCYRGRRARRRHPGRDHRRQPRAARALRLPHPRGVDARGHRPGRAGARAQPCALPDARRARCARSPSTRRPLVSAAFFWKLLSLEGFHPMLDAVRPLRRRATGPFTAFDLEEGGVLCAHVRSASPAGGSTPDTAGRWSGASSAASCGPRSPSRPGRDHDRHRAARARQPRAPPRAPSAQRRAALTPADPAPRAPRTRSEREKGPD